MFQFHSYASLSLRIGLAFVFFYAAIYMSIAPKEYIHFMPDFVRSLTPGYLSLHIFAALEIILSLWLLSGKLSFFAGLLSALILFSLTTLNYIEFNILFRNVAAIFAGLSLAAMHYKDVKIFGKKQESQPIIQPPELSPNPQNPVPSK